MNGACDPAANDHAEEDILGTGAGVSESINAQNIGNWCGGFGGPGVQSSYPRWRDCIRDSHRLLADSAVSIQYPRMLEWLEAVRPFMAAVTPPGIDPTKVSDALAGLDQVNDEDVEGLADDDVPIGQAGTDFPASGQTTSVFVGDDGDRQTGAALRYADNGDGTITDLNTGLMWEKKVALDFIDNAGNLHDADNCYPWAGICSVTTTTNCGTDADCPGVEICVAGDCQVASGLTIFEWLAALNASGFAGHSDWRVPNVKELQSIVDYGVLPPIVDAAFQGASCGGACTDLADPACSCTRSSNYWSASSLPGNSSFAWNVHFNLGGVVGIGTDEDFFVRAVRGGR